MREQRVAHNVFDSADTQDESISSGEEVSTALLYKLCCCGSCLINAIFYHRKESDWENYNTKKTVSLRRQLTKRGPKARRPNVFGPREYEKINKSESLINANPPLRPMLSVPALYWLWSAPYWLCPSPYQSIKRSW